MGEDQHKDEIRPVDEEEIECEHDAAEEKKKFERLQLQEIGQGIAGYALILVLIAIVAVSIYTIVT